MADVPNGTDIHDVSAAIAFLYSDQLPPDLYERLANIDGETDCRIADLVLLRRRELSRESLRCRALLVSLREFVWRYRTTLNLPMARYGEFACNVVIAEIDRLNEVGEWLGESLTLQVDHIDGDWQNNQEGNLRYLCPNCHQQTPNFGNKHASVPESGSRGYA